jgi:Putative transmembrane protein (Alph_Pro_TM)
MKQPTLLKSVAILLSALLAGTAWGADSANDLTAQVTPSVVAMGTFYGGAKVRVQGTTVAGSSLVVVVRGAEVTEIFNKVGRVGPIWVNTGKVLISGVPSVCLVFSSCPVCNCLCRSELDRCELDAAALKKRIQVKPQHQGGEPIADDFLKLKVRQGKYQMEGGGIQFGEVEPAAPVNQASFETPSPAGAALSERQAGVMPYTLEFVWPKTAAPGTYAVRVYACRDNMVRESLEVPLRVQEVGFPALIASTARDHPAAYGVICIVVAMLAGFGIDFIVSSVFKKKIASH